MTIATYGPALERTRTIPALTALNASLGRNLPRDAEVRDRAELLAVRAMRVIPTVLPFTRGCASDDFETALTDLVGDLRHLADHLGVDFRRVVSRSARAHREEVAGAH
ncbi:hypothetical protein [Prescottella equi]|uniref:hypothetical protein n=1 Tax=Rhodococcus hoagii TaxID=43767 RepID=UPI00384A662D